MVGDLDILDLNLVLLNWGRDVDSEGVPAGWTNNLPTGQITQVELNGVLLNWGSSSESASSVVPEPGSALIFVASVFRLRLWGRP